MNGPEKFFFGFNSFFLSFSPQKLMGKLYFSSVNLTNFAAFLGKIIQIHVTRIFQGASSIWVVFL